MWLIIICFYFLFNHLFFKHASLQVIIFNLTLDASNLMTMQLKRSKRESVSKFFLFILMSLNNFESNNFTQTLRLECFSSKITLKSLRLGSRWRVKNLTYKISKYPSRLVAAEVDNELAKAFNVWSDYTDLTFTQKRSGQVHIEIR